ncbi:DMT family transporter [Curvibacter sp. CHRR-16]|uniref:DMT family transporter n=1 Tax=Curvibacter sp. CHRR-16 TaxID=2835872 RepID=UPI001BDACF78|nr:DMT family transporter [Curvibacter sp. CHRR-16]MBT0569847.1 DMT family transporter [Curvibacter sp. CHRR-16]
MTSQTTPLQPTTPLVASTPASRETLGLWLGLVGVALFALTAPMTRLAAGTEQAPTMSAWFIASARAVLAGALSIVFLLITRSRLPSAAERKPLLWAALGSVVGFPVLLASALRVVDASHAAVITALLPLATAAMAAWVMGQRAHWGFWLCAVLGAALVVVYALHRGHAMGHGFSLSHADWLLLGAVLMGSLGYVHGARITPSLGAEQVICWICVAALPLTVPVAILTWPSHSLPSSAWWGLAYTGVFSMWAGFFAWYRGLALGGTLKVSQVQLLQPFFSIVAAIPLLGETLDGITLAFALGVVLTVFIGKRFTPQHAPSQSASTRKDNP